MASVRIIIVITIMGMLCVPTNHAIFNKLQTAFESTAGALEMIPTILSTASGFGDDEATKKIQNSLNYLAALQEELSELNDLVIIQNAVADAKKKIQACTESLWEYLNHSSAVSRKEVEDCRLIFIEVKFLAHVLHGRTVSFWRKPLIPELVDVIGFCDRPKLLHVVEYLADLYFEGYIVLHASYEFLGLNDTKYNKAALKASVTKINRTVESAFYECNNVTITVTTSDDTMTLQVVTLVFEAIGFLFSIVFLVCMSCLYRKV